MRSVGCLIGTMIFLSPSMLLAADEPSYVTERGRLICTSPESLKEALRAVDARDKAWLESIRECSQSRAGLKAEIMQGGVLTAKIKIYDEAGKWTIYWTSPTTVKEVRR